MSVTECSGQCDECTTPDSCHDQNICKQHTGNTAKISGLQERVGDLEDRDSVVDNLTGRVNLLINISLIVIAAIIGDFAHSFTVNRKFEAKYQVDQLALKDTLAADRLALKDTLHEMNTEFMDKIDDLSDTMGDEIQTMSDTMEDKIDGMAKETDKRFDIIERELPAIEREVNRMQMEHKERPYINGQ